MPKEKPLTLHRLKPMTITDKDLRTEVDRLVSDVVLILGDDLLKVIQFGSSLGGVSAMHQDSDIDLCLVLKSGTSHRAFYGKLPISKSIAVDWILVNEDEFIEKSVKRHGVFHLVNCDGKVVWEKSNGKI